MLTNLAGANPEEFIDEIAGQFMPDLLAVNGGGLPMPVKRLRSALLKAGFSGAPAVYDRLRRQDSTFGIAEDDLNAWGGMLLGEHKADQAVAVFGLNVRLHPQSANAHDSLAEAYEAKGAFALAEASYKASLALDPYNGHAASRLQILSGKSPSVRSSTALQGIPK